MSTEKYQNRYRIPSVRAKWHDYNGGIYFITICTKNHDHYFGSINDGAVHLSEIGKYADENLKNVALHYPCAEIPLFVVMPNHLHAIVIIDGGNDGGNGNDAGNVETRRASSLQPEQPPQTTKNEKMQNISKEQSLLSICIGGFKSAVTKFANENKIDFAWQARFHDRVICNSNEMNRIVNYIENNVSRWDSDCYNLPL